MGLRIDTGRATYDGFQEAWSWERIQAGHTVLMQGHGGESVERLQRDLAALGYLDADGVDGKFGPQTRAALEAFQTAAGLDVDGLFGPLSMAALGGAIDAREPEEEAIPALPAFVVPETPVADTYVPASDPSPEARAVLAQRIIDDPWDAVTIESSYAREQLAEHKEAVLDEIRSAAAAFDDAERAAILETVDELAALYDDLSDQYYFSNVYTDGARANQLEEQIAEMLGGPQ